MIWLYLVLESIDPPFSVTVSEFREPVMNAVIAIPHLVCKDCKPGLAASLACCKERHPLKEKCVVGKQSLAWEQNTVRNQRTISLHFLSSELCVF